jgi:hypothetical protein
VLLSYSINIVVSTFSFSVSFSIPFSSSSIHRSGISIAHVGTWAYFVRRVAQTQWRRWRFSSTHLCITLAEKKCLYWLKEMCAQQRDWVSISRPFDIFPLTTFSVSLFFLWTVRHVIWDTIYTAGFLIFFCPWGYIEFPEVWFDGISAISQSASLPSAKRRTIVSFNFIDAASQQDRLLLYACESAFTDGQLLSPLSVIFALIFWQFWVETRTQ